MEGVGHAQGEVFALLDARSGQGGGMSLGKGSDHTCNP